jgi:hypothetical protein
MSGSAQAAAMSLSVRAAAMSLGISTFHKHLIPSKAKVGLYCEMINIAFSTLKVNNGILPSKAHVELLSNNQYWPAQVHISNSILSDFFLCAGVLSDIMRLC